MPISSQSSQMDYWFLWVASDAPRHVEATLCTMRWTEAVSTTAVGIFPPSAF